MHKAEAAGGVQRQAASHRTNGGVPDPPIVVIAIQWRPMREPFGGRQRDLKIK
jgi:hypothetical protein